MKHALLITTIAAAVALSSCQQVHPRFNGTFDASDKTLSINAQSNTFFASELKDALRQDGWDVRIGGVAVKSGDTIYNNKHTRYTLSLEETGRREGLLDSPLWLLLGGVGYIVSNIFDDQSNVSATIYENKTGKEIMYMADKRVRSRKGAIELAKQIKAHTK